MSSIAIQGSSAGAGVVTIAPPSTSSSYTVTLPSGTSTLVTTTETQTLTNKTLTSPSITSPSITSPVITGASVSSMNSSVLTFATAQSVGTGNTFIDITGVPSWAKRITVMFNGVNTTTTSLMLLQVGAGSVTTTGYTAAGIGIQSNSASATSVTSAAGFFVSSVSTDATLLYTGIMTLHNITGTTWLESANLVTTNGGQRGSISSGFVTLGGALDRIRLTTVLGTATFSNGSINIVYE